MFPIFLELNLNWLPAVSHKERFFFGHYNKSFADQADSVKMARY